MSMRIAIITTSYPKFLRRLYLDNPGLEGKSYTHQLQARNDSMFALADFYSKGFQAHGHEAAEFHVNNSWLQHAWAREHGVAMAQPLAAGEATGAPGGQGLKARLRGAIKPLRPLVRRFVPPPMPQWQYDVLAAQIEHYNPDIIYNQEPSTVSAAFLQRFRRPGRNILAQIASARPPWEHFRGYDVVVSSLPNFVAHFRKTGVPSAYNRLAFEPSVYERVGPQVRDIPLSFVGSVAEVHKNRLAMLEYVAERLPLEIWGTDVERLPASSPLHRCYRGEAWGHTMFGLLGRSQITLNNHEAVAGIHANNLRLFEASGMGALQLVDHKSDLSDIYLPGEEVAAFTSLEDCVRQAERLMGDTAARERIAAAGQKRAFGSHSYHRRTGELLDIFDGVRAGKARTRWLEIA
jgi:spore maturation protein CgeB